MNKREDLVSRFPLKVSLLCYLSFFSFFLYFTSFCLIDFLINLWILINIVSFSNLQLRNKCCYCCDRVASSVISCTGQLMCRNCRDSRFQNCTECFYCRETFTHISQHVLPIHFSWQLNIIVFSLYLSKWSWLFYFV